MKGQVGVETLFIFGFLILVFLFAFVSYIQRSEDIEFASQFFDGNKICNTVKESVNQAHTSGWGSRVYFKLPDKIRGNKYNVTVNSFSQSLIVSWNRNTVSCPMITRNVTNSTHSFFKLNGTSNVARNENGIILLQNA